MTFARAKNRFFAAKDVIAFLAEHRLEFGAPVF
jgi:hypothetical protein